MKAIGGEEIAVEVEQRNGFMDIAVNMEADISRADDVQTCLRR